MQKDRTATLILDDGTVFQGFSFGFEKPIAGEVVFNTAMTGYPESLTDPSYAGQLMVLTYPLVGNYGVPPRVFGPNGLSTFMESEHIHASAIIVSDYSREYSHWNAECSLGDWLKQEEIPGIYGIDTRALTKKLREHGVMMGRIVFNEELRIKNEEFPKYGDINYVDKVSCKEIIVYTPDGKAETYPADSSYFNPLEYDGLFISNGPGDPDTCEAAVLNIRKALIDNRPICGICMGNQLLAKAGGASIYKLKYGHRSHNQPVRMVGTNQCFITSQNHGYAVDSSTLGADWEPLFINMNDGSNEGIRHKTKPFFSSQFHPEACGGPTDTEALIFDKFIGML